MKTSGRERQIPYFTYMWNLKNRTNKQANQRRNKLMDTEDKLMVARGDGGEGMGGTGEEEI